MGSNCATCVGSSLTAVQAAQAAGDGEGRVGREVALTAGMRLVKDDQAARGRRPTENMLTEGSDWPRSPVETTLPRWFFATYSACIQMYAIVSRGLSPQGLANVSLCFFGAAHEKFTETDIAWAWARFRSSRANACSHSAMYLAQRAWLICR